jgi:hypothetical protein
MAGTINIRTDGEIKRRARQLSESPGSDMPMTAGPPGERPPPRLPAAAAAVTADENTSPENRSGCREKNRRNSFRPWRLCVESVFNRRLQFIDMA